MNEALRPKPENLISEIANRFREADWESHLLNVKRLMVRWDDGGNKHFFPPYVPYVGKEYDRSRILLYGTAQNLASWPGLRKEYYEEGEDAAYRRLSGKTSRNQVDVQPFSDGVFQALGILYHRVLTGDWLTRSIDEAFDCFAVSNFYKFSLWDRSGETQTNSKHKDLNPSQLYRIDFDEYSRANLELFIEPEIEILSPRAILAFKPGYSFLKRDGEFHVFHVRDPSWLKRGGSGQFKPGRTYYESSRPIGGSHKDVDEWLDQLANGNLGPYTRKNAIIEYLRLHCREMISLLSSDSD